VTRAQNAKSILLGNLEELVLSPGLKIAASLCFDVTGKTLTMRTLRSIVALVTVAVIVGQGRTERRSAIASRKLGLQLSSNSELAQILVRACGNCHSNHPDWPWYSHVAPVSWWIARHVREGREKLDFRVGTYSAWQKRDKLESICGLIATGRMPPRIYTAMHPRAKLTEENKKTVCAWGKEATSSGR
jgi:hypothetical protein